MNQVNQIKSYRNRVSDVTLTYYEFLSRTLIDQAGIVCKVSEEPATGSISCCQMTQAECANEITALNIGGPGSEWGVNEDIGAPPAGEVTDPLVSEEPSLPASTESTSEASKSSTSTSEASKESPAKNESDSPEGGPEVSPSTPPAETIADVTIPEPPAEVSDVRKNLLDDAEDNLSK